MDYFINQTDVLIESLVDKGYNKNKLLEIREGFGKMDRIALLQENGREMYVCAHTHTHTLFVGST